MKKTQLLKNTSVPKRKNFWKRLLYFWKKKKVQNEVKQLLKKTSVPKKTTFEKTSVPKREDKIEKEKSSKWSKNNLNKTSAKKSKNPILNKS